MSLNIAPSVNNFIVENDYIINEEAFEGSITVNNPLNAIDSRKLEEQYEKIKKDLDQMLDNIKKVNITESEIKCPICLDTIDFITYEIDRVIEMKGCPHKYHYECIRVWLDYKKIYRDIEKIKHIKCELCQVERDFKIKSNVIPVKNSNRFNKCLIM